MDPRVGSWHDEIWVPGGVKRRILSCHLPPAQRYTIIALQNRTECCLEFTASAVIKCFLSCLVNSAPTSPPGRRLATNDNPGRLTEESPSLSSAGTSPSEGVQGGGG